MSPTFLTLAGALGWVGAAGTVVAYALVSLRVITATSRTFQASNAAGAALLTVSATAHDSWPSAASNVVWALIAVAALVRARRARLAGVEVLDRALDAAPAEPVEPAAAAERVPVAA